MQCKRRKKTECVESLPHVNVTQADCKGSAVYFAQRFPSRGNLMIWNLWFTSKGCLILPTILLAFVWIIPLLTRYKTPPANSESHRCRFPTEAHRGVNSPGIINADVSVLLGCNAMSLVIWFPTFLHDATALKYRQTIIQWHGVTTHNNRNVNYSIA